MEYSSISSLKAFEIFDCSSHAIKVSFVFGIKVKLKAKEKLTINEREQTSGIQELSP